MMFEIAMFSAEYNHGKSNEEIAEWVAHNLKECGFPTTPCGMSWGVLNENHLP